MSKKDTKTAAVALPPFSGFLEAIAFLRRQLKTSAVLIPVFCHRNIPSKEELAAWQKLCSKGREPFLIDVGANPKAANFGSSAETTELPAVPAFNVLLGHGKKLNGREFRKVPHFMPAFLQDVYFLGKASEAEVFERVLHVAKAFVFGPEVRPWKALTTEARYKDDMLALWKSLQVGDSDLMPFTVQQYFQHLFCAGIDRAEIKEKVGWWMAMQKAAGERFRKAVEKSFTVKPFLIHGRGGTFIQVEDYWDARAFHYQWVGSGILRLAIIRTKSGHVVIQTPSRLVDFTPLHHRLSADEPGRWYLHSAVDGKQTLLNGGFRYDGEKPTGKRSAELVRLVYKYIAFRS